MLLRSAAHATAQPLAAAAPIVPAHVRPLQHAVLAAQLVRQLQLHLEPAGHLRRHRVLGTAVGQPQRRVVEALVRLVGSVQIAQLELEVAHVIGGQLHLHRQRGARLVRLDDGALAVFAAQLVRPRLGVRPVVAAQAAATAVGAELRLRVADMEKLHMTLLNQSIGAFRSYVEAAAEELVVVVVGRRRFVVAPARLTGDRIVHGAVAEHLGGGQQRGRDDSGQNGVREHFGFTKKKRKKSITPTRRN